MKIFCTSHTQKAKLETSAGTAAERITGAEGRVNVCPYLINTMLAALEPQRFSSLYRMLIVSS